MFVELLTSLRPERLLRTVSNLSLISRATAWLLYDKLANQSNRSSAFRGDDADLEASTIISRIVST